MAYVVAIWGNFLMHFLGMILSAVLLAGGALVWMRRLAAGDRHDPVRNLRRRRAARAFRTGALFFPLPFVALLALVLDRSACSFISVTCWTAGEGGLPPPLLRDGCSEIGTLLWSWTIVMLVLLALLLGVASAGHWRALRKAGEEAGDAA